MSERLDDAAVIERSWHDGEQFAAVFDRHAPAVHRYLARRVGGDLADDLTAQTFLVAFDRRRAYDLTRPSALPWLYGIATRLAGRHRRTETRQYRALARTGLDPAQDGHADRVAERVTASAVGRRLADALAGLPKGQRDVLLLVAWEGLSYDEVAAALDIPGGTVRSRLNRARARLRAALGGTDPTSDQHSGDPA